MRVVIQRVSEAKVTVDDQVIGKIEEGLLVLLGISPDDTKEEASWLANKIVNQRIFSDDQDRMNLSVKEIGGKILLISQFTLFASVKKGKRPSFTKAARPEIAIPLYEFFQEEIKGLMGNQSLETGRFGADMKVSLCNDGPVTIVIDTKNKE